MAAVIGSQSTLALSLAVDETQMFLGSLVRMEHLSQTRTMSPTYDLITPPASINEP
jgi:hypothetical protein